MSPHDTTPLDPEPRPCARCAREYPCDLGDGTLCARCLLIVVHLEEHAARGPARGDA